MLSRGLAPGVLLNVNVPTGAPRGVRITRQGTRRLSRHAEERLDPSGRPYYWIAAADSRRPASRTADHTALRERFVSVTPLHANLTHEGSLAAIARLGLDA